MNYDNSKKMKRSFTASERYDELLSLCFSEMNEKQPDSILDVAISSFFTQSSSSSISYLTMAAEAGSPEAMCKLGLCYRLGTVIEPDPDKSILWLMRAAQSGDVTAQLEAAAHYENSLCLEQIDYKSAFSLYTMASLAGNSYAHLKLAEYYEYGNGVDRNTYEAFRLCLKAAEAGNTQGLCTLGRYYELGIGTEPDINKAIAYYELAANTKSPEAQTNLNRLTNNANMTKTSALYESALNQTYDELSSLYGVDAVRNAYYNAINGDETALLICGLLHHSTIKYCVYSSEKAFVFFRKAALLGNPMALWYVADYYMSGRYVMRNPSEAFRLFKMSAEKDYAPAIWALGFCKEYKLGTEKNINEAVELYTKAADMGYIPAKATLAILYETGTHIKPDYIKSTELYKSICESHDKLEPWADIRCYYSNFDSTMDNLLRYRVYRFDELRTGDSSKFFGAYGRLAESNNVFAMYRLGLIFENGTQKSNKHPERAFTYYRKAADLGYKPAEDELLRFNANYPMIVASYLDGLGTEEAAMRAFPIYLSLAKSGNLTAMYKITNIYRNGIGIDPDLHESYKWSCKIRAMGSNDYSDYEWHHISYPADLPEDELKKYYTSKSNDPSAIYSLGVCYETGFGVEKNDKRAAALYYDAAQKDYVHAHYALARCYENGLGVEKNMEAAAEQYLTALLYEDKLAKHHFTNIINKILSDANQHLPAMQSIIGLCFEHGYGVNTDKYTAYSYYSRAAEQEYALGIYLLGRCFHNGIGTAPNPAKAFELYAQAARKGCNAATCAIAQSFESGVNANVETAVTWYKAACDASFCDAFYKLGHCILDIDDTNAVKYILHAANLEHSIAQYELGKYYYNKDIEQSLSWYTRSYENGNLLAELELGRYYLKSDDANLVKRGYNLLFHAARRGDSDAQLEIAECMARGIYVPKSPSGAVKWYLRSADAGNANACYSLGSCYERGFGIDVDLDKAAYYYSLAADENHSDAQYALGACYAKGKGTEPNMPMAVYWYQRSVENGNDKAQTALGICYENGQGGLSVDINAAMDLYRLSAAQGNYIAQYRLGLCYERGRYIPCNPEMAVYWYEQSSSAGNAIAQLTLGKCYENGFGVKKDMKKAIEFYNISAENRCGEAAFRLGQCYESGYGVVKSQSKADEWYNKARSMGYRPTDKFLRNKKY